jgi:hypothetical protein
MEQILFPELSPEKRVEMLENNCDALEEKGFTRRFTEEEIAEMKTNLSEVAITVNDVEMEKKQHAEVFNSQLKPLKNQQGTLLVKLKNKAEYIKDICYKFIDQQDGKVGFYNSEGVLIESRQILPNERQKTIFNIAK